MNAIIAPTNLRPHDPGMRSVATPRPGAYSVLHPRGEAGLDHFVRSFVSAVTITPRRWRFPSRAECMTCHSRAANFVLGVTELQLTKVHDYGGVRDNQLRTLQHIGVFTGTLPKPEADRLVDPYDTNHSLDARARSYLHVNCSV